MTAVRQLRCRAAVNPGEPWAPLQHGDPTGKGIVIAWTLGLARIVNATHTESGKAATFAAPAYLN